MKAQEQMKKRKLTFIRVYWKDGTCDDLRPFRYRNAVSYKDVADCVSATRKIRRVVTDSPDYYLGALEHHS